MGGSINDGVDDGDGSVGGKKTYQLRHNRLQEVQGEAAGVLECLGISKLGVECDINVIKDRAVCQLESEASPLWIGVHGGGDSEQGAVRERRRCTEVNNQQGQGTSLFSRCQH